ncbi:MAG: hypothetical protein ABWZ76_14025 [Acidimicrobiales bacterium]
MASPTRVRPARPWTTGRALVLLIVVAMVSMWLYVLYLAFGPGRQPPPDRLDDPRFATAAQSRCEVALDAVRELPRATESLSASERGDVVLEANAIFATMLDELAELTPAGEDGELVTAWLADWRIYLTDRAEYADAVRQDPEARLLVSAKDNEQITEFIDAFAADNKMISCGTPLDV